MNTYQSQHCLHAHDYAGCKNHSLHKRTPAHISAGTNLPDSSESCRPLWAGRTEKCEPVAGITVCPCSRRHSRDMQQVILFFRLQHASSDEVKYLGGEGREGGREHSPPPPRDLCRL